MGASPTTTGLFLTGFSGSRAPARPWRDLPEEFGKWSRAYRQFRRWRLVGLYEDIIDALNQSRAVPDALQMIDSTVIRAHHPAAGAKGDSATGYWLI